MDELAKPSGDIMPDTACSHTRLALAKFMMLILYSKRVSIRSSDSLDDLFQRCAQTDEYFNRLEFRALSCKQEPMEKAEGCYCVDLCTVSRCSTVLGKVKDYFFDTLKLDEMSFSKPGLL